MKYVSTLLSKWEDEDIVWTDLRPGVNTSHIAFPGGAGHLGYSGVVIQVLHDA